MESSKDNFVFNDETGLKLRFLFTETWGGMDTYGSIWIHMEWMDGWDGGMDGASQRNL